MAKCTSNESFFIVMTNADLDWNGTVFGFELKEVSGKTLLSFSHKKWPYNNQHFRISSFCWAMLLNGLKNYIEKGEILPFEERF